MAHQHLGQHHQASFPPRPAFVGPQPPVPPPPKNGFGLAALIVGIVAIALSWIPVINAVAIVLGLVGLSLTLVGLVQLRRRRATNTVATLVGGALALVAIVAAIAISGAFVDALDEELNASQEPSLAAPSTSDNDTDTPADPQLTPTPDQPEVFGIGDTGTVSEGGADIGAITVTKVDQAAQPATNFGDLPKNGRFWIVTIKARAIGTSTFDINPFDFYIRDSDGTRFEYGDGNAIGAIEGKELDATTLNPGEQATGRIVFDAPASGALELVYAPGLRALGSWKLQ